MNYLANIEGGEIVIRVPIDAIPNCLNIALERAWGEHKLLVEDLPEFTKEFVNKLNEENEIGETVVHRMLDAAIVAAVGDGAFGVSEQ